MTDRHAAYVVTLREDIREDDAEAVMTALRMVSGVVDVQPVIGDFVHQQIAEGRVRADLRERVWAVIRDAIEGGKA